MTTSKGTSRYNQLNWEESDFPIVCEACFGSNPFMRMIKSHYGKECGVCTRPYTVFRWIADENGKQRQTEICQICCRTKNVCQSCIMDLDFGLPVQVRDQYLNIGQNIPKGPVNLEYNQQLIEREMELGGDISTPYQNFKNPGKMTNNTIRMLSKLAQTEPYSRNKLSICTFYVKGECKRGESCPFRHEAPSEPYDPINEQHIRDRYYGVDDNIANRIIEKYESIRKSMIQPPEDLSITTIEVSGLPNEYGENDTMKYFSQFGEVRSVARLIDCWSIKFTSRETAAKAAKMISEWHELGHIVNARWALSNQGVNLSSEVTSKPASDTNVPPLLQQPSGFSNAPVTKRKFLPPLPQQIVPSVAPPPPSTSQSDIIGQSYLYDSQRTDRIANKVHPA